MVESIFKVNQHLPQNGLKPIAGVKNIIAVASGKGGVGKSTTAINVALALQALGARVGVLDADIYGPSQPHLLSITQKPVLRADKRLEPVLQYGLQTMSMGYLVEAGAPMVWRGPMVSRALEQLLNETAWDALDYLMVDMPPGTGDIPLTLAQKIPVAGVVIVTTPQAVALLDVRKALEMFKKLGIAVLGVVENMSTHVCGACGHTEAIFGQGGGNILALEYGIPVLGTLPLDRTIQEQADLGHPSVMAYPDGPVAQLYRDLALAVHTQLSFRPRNPFAVPIIID